MDEIRNVMKISAVVPAYNEGVRVNSVLDALCGHPYIDEVVVVNDGSHDNTEAVLRQRRDIKLISYQPNRGKSHAVMLGMQAAKNDFVAMIDSDLYGLDRAAVSALIEPILSGAADVSISLRKNSLLLYKLLGLDFVSGERVFNKKIIGDLAILDTLPGFGLETFLNQVIIDKKLRIRIVYLEHVVTPRKRVKEGWLHGTISDYKMVGVIIRMIGFVGLVRVFKNMLAQKV